MHLPGRPPRYSGSNRLPRDAGTRGLAEVAWAEASTCSDTGHSAAQAHRAVLSSCGAWTPAARYFTLHFTAEVEPCATIASVAVTHSPLTGPPPAELPLPHAPLVRVLVQVRFPNILSVEKREFIAPFQEAIRRDYSVLNEEKTRDMLLGPEGVLTDSVNTAWRFLDRTGTWRVSLAMNFLALETRVYDSRSGLLDRLRRILEALEETVGPTDTDRLGVRYVNRVEANADEDLHSLIPTLVKPEVAGVLGTNLQPRHSITENVFELAEEDARVTTRWGVVPEGRTLDPSILEPARRDTWLLDIDVFQSKQQEFSVDRIVEQAESFARREYTIFRWAVTDAFLSRYGGKL